MLYRIVIHLSTYIHLEGRTYRQCNAYTKLETLETYNAEQRQIELMLYYVMLYNFIAGCKYIKNYHISLLYDFKNPGILLWHFFQLQHACARAL